MLPIATAIADHERRDTTSITMAKARSVLCCDAGVGLDIDIF